MAREDDRTELRIAVVMSGGVSLAIWMGGVAAELLRLLDKPEDYGIDHTRYRPVIDIITGASAGGLNGALMGAAIAWGVPPERFVEDVRRTWVELADFEQLLRPVGEKDPPSLLRGAELFEATLLDVFRSWHAAHPSASPGPSLYHGQDAPSVSLTATRLTPHRDRFHDSLGQVLLEPRHTATITFDERSFSSADIAEKLARAGRASAAFPVAFEPAFLDGPKGPGPDMVPLVRDLPDTGVWAMDGGVLANRPLGLAFDAIKKRPAHGPFERVVAFVVPDPAPDHDANGPGSDRWQDPSSVPSIREVLGKVVEASRTESLADDLERWRDQNLSVKRQRDLRLTFGSLTPAVVDELVTRLYPSFLKQRAAGSVAENIKRLIEHAGRDQTNWQSLATTLQDALQSHSWFPEVGEFPTPPPRPGQQWQWSLSALAYVAETIRWMLHQLADDHVWGDETAECLDTVEAVLATLDSFRPVSTEYWKWQLDSGGIDNPHGPGGRGSPSQEAEKERLAKWAEDAYRTWPVIPRDEVPQPFERALRNYLDRYEDAPLNGLESSHVRHLLSRRAGTPALTQNDHRQLLAFLALRLGEAFTTWHQWWQPGGAPGNTDVGALVEACMRSPTPPPTDSTIDPLVPIWHLVRFWIIEMSTNQRIITGESIDLFQVSTGHTSAAAPRGLLPAEALRGIGKVTGLQLAHFGAFYRPSWRANDWMWGRVDGAAHLARLIASRSRIQSKDGAVESLRKRHQEIGRRELAVLRHEVELEKRDGQLGRVEEDLLEALEGFDSASATDDDVERGLTACRLGQQRIGEDTDSSRFAVVTTKAMTVAAAALTGQRGGPLGPLRHPLAQIRNVALLPLHTLAVLLRRRAASPTAAVALATFFVVSALVIVADIGLGLDLPPLLVGVAFVALAGFTLLAFLQVRGWRIGVGTAAAVMVLAALGLSSVLTWWEGIAASTTGDIVLRCGTPPAPIRLQDGNFAVGQGCEVVEAAAGGPIFRAEWFGIVGLAAVLVALAIHALQLRRADQVRRALGPRLRYHRPRAVLADATRVQAMPIGVGLLVALGVSCLALWWVTAEPVLAGGASWLRQDGVPWLVEHQTPAILVALLLPPTLAGLGLWPSPGPDGRSSDGAALAAHLAQLRSRADRPPVGYLLGGGTSAARKEVADGYVAGPGRPVLIDPAAADGPAVDADILSMVDDVVIGGWWLADAAARRELGEMIRAGHHVLLHDHRKGGFFTPRAQPGRWRLRSTNGNITAELVDSEGRVVVQGDRTRSRPDAEERLEELRRALSRPEACRPTGDEGRFTFSISGADGTPLGSTDERFDDAEVRDVFVAWIRRWGAISPGEND